MSFQLKPKAEGGSLKFTGKELFDHMVNFARRTTLSSVPLRPSEHLDVEMTPMQARLSGPNTSYDDVALQFYYKIGTISNICFRFSCFL